MSQTGPWGTNQQPQFPQQTPAYPGTPQWQQARPGWQQPAQGSAPWQQAPQQAYGQPAAPQYAGTPQSYPAQPVAMAPTAYAGQPQYQPNAWAPQPGYGVPAAPKKKTKILPILLIVGIFVIGIPVILALISDEEILDNPPTPRPTQTTGPTTDPTNTNAPPGGDRYQEGPPDLNPGDPGEPESWEEVADIVLRNSLYSQNLQATNCTVNNIDLANASVSQIEAHMNEFVVCLMKSWYGPVEDAGYYMPRPSITVYTTAITTACGEVPMENAIYCGADQQIYYAQNLINVFPSSMQKQKFLAEAVVAHEFGHAVQFRSMILVSSWALEYIQETDEQVDVIGRWVELQADCFAGVFFNSITDSAGITSTDVSNIRGFFEFLGSDTLRANDHGAGVNRSYWAGQGISNSKVGVCNTFAVSDDTVG
ncbi:MAG: neutral zinc metallopeptidase [Propionibacteriaceae bacterium]|nr:neutral zinc metallopeptidase [Propionibacteriaceae bacterium]